MTRERSLGLGNFRAAVVATFPEKSSPLSLRARNRHACLHVAFDPVCYCETSFKLSCSSLVPQCVIYETFASVQLKCYFH